MLFLRSAVLLASVAGASQAAAAPWHATFMGGGDLRIDAPSLGAWAAAELWPSAWGVRIDAHLGFDGPILVEASAARALGATWRHFVISLHAGAGADLRAPGLALTGGIAVELGLGLGPLMVVGDVTTHFVIWDERSDLVLTATLGLGLAY